MDNGNGALMRLSPLAILMQEEFDFSNKVKIIERYTKITHRHPRSIAASILYGLLRDSFVPRIPRKTYLPKL